MTILPILALVPAAFACDQIPAGQIVWVRLTSPVSSYTAKPGDTVNGVLTEAIQCESNTEFPIGTHVTGVVHSVRKVGWGIRHETAALDLEFNELHPDSGQPVKFVTSLTEVENAREQVSSKGMIQGVRSSDTPQGRINSRLIHLPTWNPYSDLGLIVYKATFPIFPEPEIYLPEGTDLRLKLDKPMPAPSRRWRSPRWIPRLMPPTISSGRNFRGPSRTAPPRRRWLHADLINLVFVGSREQVVDAFRDAGWVNSDTFNRHAFMHDFYAFLNNSGYPQDADAPVPAERRACRNELAEEPEQLCPPRPSAHVGVDGFSEHARPCG